MPIQRPRLLGLDALRGFAACAIVAFHVAGIHGLDVSPYLSVVRERFGIGVPLFFVLSAFSLYYADFHRAISPDEIRRFLRRRFLRIAPLFYAMLVFCLIARPIFQDHHYNLAETLANLTFIFNFLPGKEAGIVWASWSIGVEFPFYLMLPIVFCLVRDLRTALVFLLFTVAVSATSAIILASVPDLPASTSRMHILPNLVFFGFGIVAFFIYRAFVGRDAQFQRRAGQALLVVACIILFAFFNDVFMWRLGVRKLGWYVGGLGFALLTLAMALAPPRAIVNRVTRRLGELSYSIFLIHVPVVYGAKALYLAVYGYFGAATWAAFLVCLAGTFAVVVPIACLTFAFIERPAMRLAARLDARERESAYTA